VAGNNNSYYMDAGLQVMSH